MPLQRSRRERGAEVTLITGKTYVPPPRTDMTVVEITTAMEMRDAVMEHYRHASIIIKAAAVADFRCMAESCQKIKKQPGGDGCMSLEAGKEPGHPSGAGQHQGG